jgi:predicted nucleic acid-binding protein
MKACVVDASTVAAALFQEEYKGEARVVLKEAEPLWAPDLICAEFGSVVWKRCRRGAIDERQARGVMAAFLGLPLRIVRSAALIEDALRLGLATGRTVYDCLYLALAVQQGCQMVTADQRLANALAGGPLERHMRWIGSV